MKKILILSFILLLLSGCYKSQESENKNEDTTSASGQVSQQEINSDENTNDNNPQEELQDDVSEEDTKMEEENSEPLEDTVLEDTDNSASGAMSADEQELIDESVDELEEILSEDILNEIFSEDAQ